MKIRNYNPNHDVARDNSRPLCKREFPEKLLRKLDIEQIASQSLRTFLYELQTETNEALRLENANASGGVAHPPFHFDYLNATVTNAHAIPHECFWFIASDVAFDQICYGYLKASKQITSGLRTFAA
jgi:hypothetical protein